MHAQSPIAILNFDKEKVEMVKLIKTEVEKLNLTVDEETFTELPTPNEVETIMKKHISVLVLGASRPEVLTIFSNIFNQDIVANEVNPSGMLRNADILKACDGKSDATVFYLQGVLFIENNFDRELVLPYLSNLTKEPTYRRKLTAKCNTNSSDVQSLCRANLSCDDDSQEIEVNISSHDLTSLKCFEKSVNKNTCFELVKTVNDENLEQLVYNKVFYNHIRNSIDCIETCFKRYGPENVFISFNGGKDCTVLLHLTLAVLKRNYPEHATRFFCVYVENQNPFPELNKFIAECEFYYDLYLVQLQKPMKESLQFVLDSRSHMKACLMGTRRTDPHSEQLQAFQMTDSDWPQVMRVSPILDWHYSDIWDYLLQLHVPYCKLYDLGYTSLGSRINTIPNPALLRDSDKLIYYPAHRLFDETKERSGRNVNHVI